MKTKRNASYSNRGSDLVQVQKKIEKPKEYHLQTKQLPDESVHDFKQRFRALSQYIQLKGGLTYLNSLPDIGGNQNGDDDDDTASVGGQSVATNTNRISIRGGQRPSNKKVEQDGKTVIRGGGGKGNGPDGSTPQ